MREDMNKVVVERPRKGSSLRCLKTRMSFSHYDPEKEYDFPKWMSSAPRSQYGYECRAFTDVLSPLRRFLHKRIGHPWNKVHSEIKKGIDSRKITGRHILVHVNREVEQDCYLGVDGKVYGTRSGKPATGLFVHPRTGLLRWIKPERLRWPRGEPEDPNRVKVDARTEFVNRKGLWFVEFFEPLDPEEIIRWKWDGLRRMYFAVRRKDARSAPKRRLIRSKQANRKELLILREHQESH